MMNGFFTALGLASLSFNVLTASGTVHNSPEGIPHRVAQYYGRSSDPEKFAAIATSRGGSNSTSIEHPNARIRRGNGSRFTYYETGLGACGAYNKDSDFIVALNIEQWDGGSHCFEDITINYNGKATRATIADLCPSCQPQALDLSPGLFEFFADLSEGEIEGLWSFGTHAVVTHKPVPLEVAPALTADVAVLHQPASMHSSRTSTKIATSQSATSTPATDAAMKTAATATSIPISSALPSTASLSAISAEAIPILAPELILGTPSVPLVVDSAQTDSPSDEGQAAEEYQTLQFLNKAIIAMGSLVSVLSEM